MERDKTMTSTYLTKEFIERCKDLAVLGLRPPQIAERMGLAGKDRSDFFEQVSNELTELHQLLRIAYDNGGYDLDAAIVTSALLGDSKSQEIALRKRREDAYLELRNDLFGF